MFKLSFGCTLTFQRPHRVNPGVCYQICLMLYCLKYSQQYIHGIAPLLIIALYPHRIILLLLDKYSLEETRDSKPVGLKLPYHVSYCFDFQKCGQSCIISMTSAITATNLHAKIWHHQTSILAESKKHSHQVNLVIIL